MTDLLHWLLWWRLPYRRRVLVTFRDPKALSLEGILWQQSGGWLVLRQAALLDAAKRTPTTVDGELLVDRRQVLFLQMF